VTEVPGVPKVPEVPKVPKVPRVPGVTGALRSTEPFWHQPGGLDLIMAYALPGGRLIEVRLRGGQAYRIEPAALGVPPPALLATLGPDPRALFLCGGDGELVSIPVERLLEACDPAYAADRSARAARRSTVGARIRALRLEAGRPAREIAAAAGMAPSNYARLEASRVDPRIDTLRRVARALEVPLEALVEETRGDAPGDRPR
jgi:DNA-binding XRE family transcriptional regulator